MAQRIVLITGCSTGVGLSTALLLAKDAEKKYKVYACMRNLAKKEELIQKASGCVDKTLFVLQMDVCSETSVLAAVKQVFDKEGRIDVLVNNAGVGLLGALEYQNWETVMNTFETNVHGVIRTIRAVLPSMKKEKKGHIINVSSVGGLQGVPFNAVYCSTKFAVEGLSESLAPELAQFNINVSVIEPGPISTHFSATVASKEMSGLETSDEETKELMKKTIETLKGSGQMKGVGQTAEEVAEYIMQAMEAEKPHLRYITNKPFEEILKKKFVDVTGDSSIQSSINRFFGNSGK